MKRWYAVYTQSRMEVWARANLWERGVEAYLPRYHKRRRHARRTEWIAAPLFPRYLFARADLSDTGRRLIGAAPGVVSLVCMGLEPAPVADAVIEDIRAREGESGLIDLERERALRPGEEVRVCAGPFRDALGLFAAPSDRERVFVLLNLLGREVRARIPVTNLSRDL